MPVSDGHAADLLAEIGLMKSQAIAQEAENTALRERVEKLEAALQPFARAAPTDDRYQGEIYGIVGGRGWVIITYDDLRRARTVLGGE